MVDARTEVLQTEHSGKLAHFNLLKNKSNNNK